MLAHDRECRARQSLDALRRRRTGSSFGERTLDVARGLLEQRPQQRLLAVEIVVEQPLRDARFLRNPPHRRGRIAIARKQAQRRVQDALATLLADGFELGTGSGHGAWRPRAGAAAALRSAVVE